LPEGDFMTLHELDRRLSDVLDLAAVAAIDRSRNGLQVSRRSHEVRRVAFAVDASLEAFRRAAAWGADALVVHHGLFWSDPVLLVGSAYERVRYLVENDLALWAAHFPLDIHPEVGNNALLARQLGLVDVVPFGLHHGVKIGCKGRLPSPLPRARVAALLGEGQPDPVTTLAFGPPEVRTVGIVSGGAPLDVEQAVHEGLDAFVTGEPAHAVYHYCREERINAFFAGHYRTESHGVKALAAWLAREAGIETTWLDVPTGM
jgi:dinuclear metal center YbgI/SA1388 family protein